MDAEKQRQAREAMAGYEAQCVGTDGYHRYFPGNVVLTDGVKLLAESCHAFWFIDIVSSWQTFQDKLPDRKFQVWKLVLAEDRVGIVTCSDGNDDVREMQRVDYTDFPLPEGAEVWCSPSELNGEQVMVVYLPCEH